jgi:hypothetical protein
MGISIQTILCRCEETYGVTFEAAYQQFCDAGLVSLRRRSSNSRKRMPQWRSF